MVVEKTAKEMDIYMECMRDNFDKQDEPQIGIFWYLAEEDELFGVNKVNAEDTVFNSNGVRTIRTLHKDWWNKRRYSLQGRNKPLGIFRLDYTAVPRGRVFQRKDGTFELMCGSWVDDYGREYIESLVKEEFNLLDVPVETIISSHWELGNGWGE
ncbi:MAG: hypothetical protein FWE37_07625 [Spirochaetaceae bacterium]|nr:hypothetical protein [Spirochaetaceae bacterium]